MLGNSLRHVDYPKWIEIWVSSIFMGLFVFVTRALDRVHIIVELHERLQMMDIPVMPEGHVV